MEIVYIAAGLLIGFIVAYLVVNLKLKASENKLLETRHEWNNSKTYRCNQFEKGLESY